MSNRIPSKSLKFQGTDDLVSIFFSGTWLGRCLIPAEINPYGRTGPVPVYIEAGTVYLLPDAPGTASEIISQGIRNFTKSKKEASFKLKELFENSLFYNNSAAPVILPPADFQCLKACGVTFASSLIERVIEEKAGGDPLKADSIRSDLKQSIGEDLSSIIPGSEHSEVLKKKFQEMGLWSQYLEVGIGPDAEVFTKSQPLSAIGFGAQAGLHPSSGWNNPEPEIVLAVSDKGEIVGATLGNDVNLRDVEGRSALLLGKAKDQNGSCSIGPFIRLFDDSFSLDDIRQADVHMTITGEDGFETSAVSSMSEISRDPANLVNQVINDSHQYPDGFMLFLGTMFAPVDDRGEKGLGFTHEYGDRVVISSEKLGSLVNWMERSDYIPRWEWGIAKMVKYLQG